MWMGVEGTMVSLTWVEHVVTGSPYGTIYSDDSMWPLTIFLNSSLFPRLMEVFTNSLCATTSTDSFPCGQDKGDLSNVPEKDPHVCGLTGSLVRAGLLTLRPNASSWNWSSWTTSPAKDLLDGESAWTYWKEKQKQNCSVASFIQLQI